MLRRCCNTLFRIIKYLNICLTILCFFYFGPLPCLNPCYVPGSNKTLRVEWINPRKRDRKISKIELIINVCLVIIKIWKSFYFLCYYGGNWSIAEIDAQSFSSLHHTYYVHNTYYFITAFCIIIWLHWVTKSKLIYSPTTIDVKFVSRLIYIF